MLPSRKRADGPYKTALLEVTVNQRKPAEDLHGSDDISLQPKPGEALDIIPRVSRLDGETSDRVRAMESRTKRRSSRGFARFLVAICIGVAGTLAWQSYGEATKQIIAASAPELGWSPEAKQMIASWVQQLGWAKLATGPENTAAQLPVPKMTQAAPVAQTAPENVTPKAPAAPSTEIVKIARQAPVEGMLILLTAAAIIILPIQTGVTIGIGLSLLDGLSKTIRTHPIELRKLPGTTVWWPPEIPGQGERQKGVAVIAFQAPLLFANAEIFKRGMIERIDAHDQPLSLVVLEASGIADIDFTAAQALIGVLNHCRMANIRFAVARLESARAHEAFNRCTRTKGPISQR
jgi:STAS domain